MPGLFDLFAKRLTPEEKRVRKQRIATIAELGLPYCIGKDGAITVIGSIDLSNENRSKLPDLSGVTVKGDYRCAHNFLLSLHGAPKKVTGEFDCSHNQIYSLEHGPEEVGGAYDCGWNFMQNLKGAPREVSDFDCSNSALEALIDAPQKVAGNFRCVNTRLSSLACGPREVGGDYAVTGACLASLCYAPEKFRRLITDFGSFAAPDDIPPELRDARTARAAASPDDPASGIALDAAICVGRPLSLVRKN